MKCCSAGSGRPRGHVTSGSGVGRLEADHCSYRFAMRFDVMCLNLSHGRPPLETQRPSAVLLHFPIRQHIKHHDDCAAESVSSRSTLGSLRPAVSC